MKYWLLNQLLKALVQLFNNFGVQVFISHSQQLWVDKQK